MGYQKARVGKGFILKTQTYMESDLIVLGFLKNMGFKSFIAKGALKSRKRFSGGCLEVFNYCEFEYSEKSQDTSLAYLKNARLQGSFEGIRTSYQKINLALSLVKSFQRLNELGFEQTEDQSLYNFIGNTLKRLNNSAEKTMPLSFQLMFHLKFLYILGVLDTQPWMEPYLKSSILQYTDSRFADIFDMKYLKISQALMTQELSRQ